ncbi:RsmB/NOP family class I SAM-dependent RNA methyltransferase, partial [Campylobacter coli]|nr:RsmB/NOP family class I SAM-dependent RNA methyltransferase [Campylobacter coli]
MEYNLASIYNDKEFENLKNSFKLPKKICCFINRLKCDNLTLEREFQDLNLEYE